MIVLIVWSMLLSVSYSTNSCSSPSPLGMESGTILDYQVSASSSFAPSVGPAMGRLHNAEGGGAWCPAIMVTNNTKEWLEVELGKKMIITGISLQGRWDNGVGQEFSPYIVLMYYDDLTHQYRRYSEKHYDEDDDDDDDYDDKYVMTGNTDTYSVVKVSLDTPVLTSRVRVIPYSYYQRTVCIRLELHGCREQQSQEDKLQPPLTWILLPVLIGVLLSCSILVMLMTTCMYVKLSRSRKYKKNCKTTEENHGVLKSDWQLQTNEKVYQDPTVTNTIESRVELNSNDEYYATKDPIYANPVDSASVSPQSTLSSLSTVFSSLELTSVKSSATSTPRLAFDLPCHYLQNVLRDFDDNNDISAIYTPISSHENIYYNIL